MNQKREWQVSIPSEGVIFSAICSHINAKEYRLDSFPAFVQSIEYGDTFEADQVGEELRVLQIIKRGGRHNYAYLLTSSARDSAILRDLLVRIEKLGGVWEQIFGGTLCISLPREVSYDPTVDVLSIV